jgi:hypothetical protein
LIVVVSEKGVDLIRIIVDFRKTLILVGMVVSLSHAVVLNGVNVPKAKCILYFFIGHSNMTGYGGVIDTEPHPRVWAYSAARGFWNAVDPVESPFRSPSPFMPFLKSMAQRYPAFYFCGIKVTQAGLPMSDQFLRGKPKYTELMQNFQKIKDSVTIGGIVAMFGHVEGASDSLSMNYTRDVITMLKQFRQDCAAPALPLIMGRYEYNSDTTTNTVYYQFKQRMISTIEQLPTADSACNRILLTPYEYVPKAYYFDSHHYNADGYSMWSGNAAEMLSSSSWNSWSSAHNPPLTMLFPRGGETFSCTTRIPITWMCAPESLSVVMVQLSQDSGKSWKVISGDKAFFPVIKTFYWTPSKSGVTFTNSKSLLFRIYDYNEVNSCRSEFFSIDTSGITRIQDRRFASRPSAGLDWYRKGGAILFIARPDLYGKTVTVYTLRGVMVHRIVLEKNIGSFAIPVSNLTDGRYLVVVTNRESSAPEIRTMFTVIQ